MIGERVLHLIISINKKMTNNKIKEGEIKY